MKDLKRKPSTIRLKIQKYMDRVSGDEATKSPHAPGSEPITEDSENDEIVSVMRIKKRKFSSNALATRAQNETLTIQKF